MPPLRAAFSLSDVFSGTKQSPMLMQCTSDMWPTDLTASKQGRGKRKRGSERIVGHSDVISLPRWAGLLMKYCLSTSLRFSFACLANKRRKPVLSPGFVNWSGGDY